MIRVASERSITVALLPESSGVQPVTTNDRAVLHFTTRSLFSRNDLVRHYVVYGATRVLDRSYTV